MATRKATDESFKARHNKRRQKRIREQKIRRYTFFTVLALIAVLSVMFFTPIFNIKTINITGNSKLSSEQIMAQVDYANGKNLFRTSKRGLRRKLAELAYTDTAVIKKRPFPPSITIEITECQPVCQVNFSESFIVIDKNAKVLEKSPEKQEGVPVLEGISVISANEDELIAFKDEETQKIVMSCIGNMEKADIIKDITTMSFEDMTNITFNYQNRLDVICGTHIDFQRKLALLKEAVNSNKLNENSRGTINLSTTGKAIYTP